MCESCDLISASRRDFFSAAGLAVAGLVVGGLGASIATPAIAANSEKTLLSPDQALAALKEGNARYVANSQVCASDLSNRRAKTATGQAPWASILSCSDSRVPPELLFGGLGLGELFVARNAGNVVDTAVMGTLEYGAAVLGSPLIVVLGHERCGAVAAACDVVTKNATFPGSILPMIQPILPAALAMQKQGGDFVESTIRESARRTAAKIVADSQIIAGLVASGKVKIVVARYDLEEGAVEFIT